MTLVREIVLVAVGGMCGALLRLGLQELPIVDFQSLLIVNLSGAFTLGLLLHSTPSKSFQLFLGTGLLGGFTTTSALAITTLTQFTTLNALLYIIATFYGGLLLFKLSRNLIHRG